MTDDFESTRRVSRGDAAGVLQRLAAGVGAGTVTVGDEGLTVDVPDAVELELEVESENGERSLEAELTWPDVTAGDVPSADETTADGESVETVSADESGVDEGRANEESIDEERVAGERGDEERVAEERRDEEQTNGQDGTIDEEQSEPEVETVGEAVAVSVPETSKASFELYRDRADEWRWRLRHRNGNVIADSGEGYDRKRGAITGMESVRANAPLADVVEESSE